MSPLDMHRHWSVANEIEAQRTATANSASSTSTSTQVVAPTSPSPPSTSPLPVTGGGSGADLGTTGGAGQYVKQELAGAPFTVGAIPAVDVPNLDASKITTGHLTPAVGGSGADLSATGGAGQVVKQTAVGAAFTVGTIAAADLPGLSVTITTAKLTLGGANGSMTFVGGLLTAQTPAT